MINRRRAESHGCLLLLLAGYAWDLPRLPATLQSVDTTRTKTLTTGLVAYFPFTGTVLDAIGNNLRPTAERLVVRSRPPHHGSIGTAAGWRR